ncbi:MAG: hypothetical protein A2126_02830 [Candidatus Woykebacteria bacterium GWB1_45_5]|uniref:PEP-utilising enzyme mobile domain-containing protein n=2 Tax=Candidatus Woykeibacteriota TaxID=1817899 RepID=A0A1G1VZW4_9BACT|nr:MAG: hypothetical protein A2113_01470 [Candidatus Woykebacteria bacterium GWA1_44_8]OGY24752.1 MAG: hypothetical protein A2126_02830 [Candidatus Woykebacteria bacterium GWB1_45_5]
MGREIKYIFDNSNLNESYSGVTTPLTYSFAKRAYERVYINFCKLLGVSNKDMKLNSDLFPNMLEYLGGRMYYNLINWYRLVALLPGYKFNRKFLEQMMGVDREHFYQPARKSNPIEKSVDFLNFMYRIFKVASSFLLMKLLVRRFNKDFDEKFSYLNRVNFTSKKDKELVKFYENFENKLTKDFSIPIVNDFAVMVSVGVLKTLASKWLDDKAGSEASYLISGGIGLKSSEPGKAIQEIVRAINTNPKPKRLFSSETPEKILSTLTSDNSFSEIKRKVYHYIENYGSRMPGELKLESISFQDNPLVLIKILKNSLNNKVQVTKKFPKVAVEKEFNKLSWIKKRVFNIALKWAQSSIAMREETRFKRTLIFGLARRVFKEFGERLRSQDRLGNADEVFYLTVDEIFGYFRNKGEQEFSFSKVVQTRKRLNEVWKNIDLPRRITTDLTPEEYDKDLLAAGDEGLRLKSNKVKVLGQLASLGNFGSVVIAESLVVVDFDPNKDYTDKILVTKQTDPGWTIIFPSLRGLVVERGGALSHAAIVAREFGIPCIINATGATKLIPNETEIKMNLKQGAVTLNG